MTNTIILGWTIVSTISSFILLYATVNLLKKQETAEDMMVSYLDYLDQISRVIEFQDVKMNQIDAKGTFKSDDEIGFFFEQIKSIQKILNEFKIK